MVRLKVRPGSAIALPEEVSEALQLAEGDEVEARLEGATLVLQKAGGTPPRDAARGFAELRARLRPSARQAAKPLDLQEEEILAAVDEARRELADAHRGR
jgi:antitoxin component of MazEF toxin-antitoxin module